MEGEDRKCVIVMDPQLPPGLLANTAAILGITLGKQLPHVVGRDVQDASDGYHMGIIEVPIPILKADRAALKKLRESLYAPDMSGLTVVDFSNLAQSCKTYDEYIRKLGRVDGAMLEYLGLAIAGEKRLVTALTGSLPLLR